MNLEGDLIADCLPLMRSFYINWAYRFTQVVCTKTLNCSLGPNNKCNQTPFIHLLNIAQGLDIYQNPPSKNILHLSPRAIFKRFNF